MTRSLLIAALGSSFAAGPTIEPVDDVAAMRSSRNYPHLLAEALDARLVDLTVSGATTATILDEPQQTLGGNTFAPQIEGVPEDADIVTATAGGNDLGFLGAMLLAAWIRRDPSSPMVEVLSAGTADALPEPTQRSTDAVIDGLSRIVWEARSRAPRARIALVDYLTIVPASPDAVADLFTAEQTAVFGRIQHALAGAYRAAADRTGAELLPMSALSVDRGLGSGDPWVFGFKATMETTAGSFHPNEAGMQAVADELAAVLAA